MNKNFFFRISGNGLFHVVFCQTFSRFLFLTLFCSLVAHIIFNQRSFCRIYPQKRWSFHFFRTMWLSHQYLPRIIFRTLLYRLQNILDQYDRTAFSLSQSIVAYQQQYNICTITEKSSSETSIKWRERPP